MRYRLFILFICLVTLLVCISCNLSKPSEVNKSEIEQILDQVKIDFRQLDLQGIMSYYHPDFFNNGNGLSQEAVIWQNRMSKYSSFDFVDLNYVINEDYTTVSGTAKWYIDSLAVTTTEPTDNGDFSYFLKENGTWHIYGNQLPAGRTK
jgi:hypothetical protein